MGLAVMAHLGFLAEAQRGQPRQRHGNELFGAFGRDFTCADGTRVMVVGLTGKQWRGLCEATDSALQMKALGARLGLDLSREGDRFHARREIAQVVGEWVGSSAGLGFYMLHANARMQIDVMFAALTILAASSLLLYFLVDHLLDRLIFWQPQPGPNLGNPIDYSFSPCCSPPSGATWVS